MQTKEKEKDVDVKGIRQKIVMEIENMRRDKDRKESQRQSGILKKEKEKEEGSKEGNERKIYIEREKVRNQWKKTEKETKQLYRGKEGKGGRK